MPLKDPVARAKYQHEYRLKHIAEYTEKDRKYRQKNKEAIRLRNNAYNTANREKVREWTYKAGRKWRKKHSARFVSMVQTWQDKNREKVSAHYKVRWALQTGTLSRPYRCEHCHKICFPQAHHEDYSKPLEVVWLCPPCHKQADYLRASIEAKPLPGGL
jgi:hypothetical protein